MPRRSGFTLIELLVAMALTVFIMTILSQAFVTGLDTFRQLKGIGDMQEGLRTAANKLRADLLADHFEGKRRLSDPAFWTEGSPTNGFFYIRQNSALPPTGSGTYYISEGLDLDNLPSYRAVDHFLYFTVKLRGNRQGDFFQASVPAGSPLLVQNTTQVAAGIDARYQTAAGTYSSQWAEVAYYLVAQGSTDVPGTNTPLYGLYRAQRVLVPENTNIAAGAVPPSSLYSGMSYVQRGSAPAYLHFPTPAEVAQTQSPTNKTRCFDLIGPVTLPLSPPPADGSSLLLSNVVSFQVQVMRAAVPGTFGVFSDLTVSGAGANAPRIFDTATGPAEVFTALQITIRVWDPATRQSRQITIVQDV